MSEKIEKQLAKARKLLENGKQMKAMGIANKIIKKDPKNGEAWYLRGRSRVSPNTLFQVLSDFESAVINGKDDYEIWTWLVTYRVSAAKTQEDRMSALEALNKVISFCPNEAETKNWAKKREEWGL